MQTQYEVCSDAERVEADSVDTAEVWDIWWSSILDDVLDTGGHRLGEEAESGVQSKYLQGFLFARRSRKLPEWVNLSEAEVGDMRGPTAVITQAVAD